MDLDQVMGMLKGKSEVKLVKFVSDKGPNSCEKCLAFHGKVFRSVKQRHSSSGRGQWIKKSCCCLEK